MTHFTYKGCFGTFHTGAADGKVTAMSVITTPTSRSGAPRRPPRLRTLGTALVASAALVVTGAWAGAASGAPQARPTRGELPPDATTSAGPAAHLDVLYVGAHPDDEASTLSTLGEWTEDYGVRAGVVTITRGEGGGNAVGPQEGPALGLLREDEERRAVGTAGVRDIINLDKVDFYYTVSEPLTRQVWGHQDTLGQLVRVVRQTRPGVLLTMNPAPSPGNHGNHQEAARLAIEAFYAAADPTAYPEQLTREGLQTWAPAKILWRGALGTASTGPACGTTFVPADATDNVYGVWSGKVSASGRTWAAIERSAQRMYASQGWAGFPDVPADPNLLGCDMFTLVDSRVPYAAPGTTEAGSPSAVLDGAITQVAGGLPLGTGLRVTTSSFRVLRGTGFTATVSVTATDRPLNRATLSVTAPAGWTVSGDGRIPAVPPRRTITRTFTIVPAADASLGGRARIAATLTTGQGVGYADRAVLVSPPVVGQQQLLSQVAQYETWVTQATEAGQLSGLVLPVLTLPSAGKRTINYTVTNYGTQAESGTLTAAVPTGFSANPAQLAYANLAPGATITRPVEVTNTDRTLRTSNQGGDYAYTVQTTSSGGTATAKAALELVPTTVIPQATTAPVVDGIDSPGEYPGGSIDLSRVWEGSACTSAADCSASAKVTWSADTLYVFVNVVDDIAGTTLDAADCKRHWRTDSVELAFDPRGTSENTSTTFKTGIFPKMSNGLPCFERDADAHQGDASTAPGMKVASVVSSPYAGYTVEVAIPMVDFPAAIDPNHFGMNLFVYDSDTQDKTGQTRIGWSTWGGVQGDPYRWGLATLPGYVPPAGRPTTPAAPIIPLTALQSVASPQTLLQAVATNFAIAGRATATDGGWATSARVAAGGATAVVSVSARTAGTAQVFIMSSGTVLPNTVLGQTTATVPAGNSTIVVPLTGPVGDGATAVVGWTGASGLLASAVPVG